MSFRKNDQNAHGKNLKVFKVEKLNPQQEETIKSLLHLLKLNNKYIYWYYLSHREYNNCKKSTDIHNIP